MYPKGEVLRYADIHKGRHFHQLEERSTVIILNRIFTILFEMFQISCLIIHNYGTAVVNSRREVYTKKEY